MDNYIDRCYVKRVNFKIDTPVDAEGAIARINSAELFWTLLLKIEGMTLLDNMAALAAAINQEDWTEFKFQVEEL